MRTITVGIVDNNGVQLVDESGNQLIARFLVTDYALSANSSRLLLHGEQATGEYNTSILTFTLVDDEGNILTDGTNELIAKFPISTRLLHADDSKTLLHGG